MLRLASFQRASRAAYSSAQREQSEKSTPTRMVLSLFMF
jgi:hypothetical protein